MHSPSIYRNVGATSPVIAAEHLGVSPRRLTSASHLGVSPRRLASVPHHGSESDVQVAHVVSGAHIDPRHVAELLLQLAAVEDGVLLVALALVGGEVHLGARKLSKKARRKARRKDRSEVSTVS